MKMMVHVMPWFGDGKIHRMDRYVSNDPAVIEKQIDTIRASRIAGQIIAGVIMTWQGPGASFQHSAVMEWCTQCEQRQMLFALLMDPWIAKIGSVGGTTVTPSLVVSALNSADTQNMLTSSAYVPELFILDFNIFQNTSYSLANDVIPHLTGAAANAVFLEQGAGFSWPPINMSITDSNARNTASLNSLRTQNANAAMRIPGISMGFNDAGEPTPVGVSLGSWTGTRDYSSSVWGGQARVLDTHGGMFFQDQLNPGVTPLNVPYWAYVTWNDYDERTAIEDSCATLAGVQIGT